MFSPVFSKVKVRLMLFFVRGCLVLIIFSKVKVREMFSFQGKGPGDVIFQGKGPGDVLFPR